MIEETKIQSLEQNSTSTNTGSPTPDPEQQQQPSKPKKHLKLLVFIVCFILTVLVVSAGIFAYKAAQPTPQDSFNTAVSAASSTKYIQQNYETRQERGGANSLTKVDGIYDFSDPSDPKAKGTIELKSGNTQISTQLKSEFICIGIDTCYVKLVKLESTAGDDIGIYKSQLNVWYKLNPSELLITAGGNSLAALPGDFLDGLNTVLGEVITGAISGAAKDLILKKINEGAYTVVSSSKNSYNDQDATKYTVKLSENALKEMNVAVAKQYNIPLTFTGKIPTDKYDFWVANDRLIATKILLEDKGKNIEIKFSYPTSKPEITAPANSKNVD